MKRYMVIDHEKVCKVPRVQWRTLALATANLQILAAQCPVNVAVNALNLSVPQFMTLESVIRVMMITVNLFVQ
jgi:hypothetical protein